MRRRPAAEVAAMMKKIGYKSVALSCKPEQFDGMVKAYREAGLRVGAVYVGWTTDGKSVSFNIPIEKVFSRLRGSGAVVMLHVHAAKGTKADDRRIAEQLLPLAKKAKKAGVTIALYPHVGYRVATLEQAVRIADGVRHPSLGVCFNLCHYLRQNDARDLPKKLRKAKGRLKLVTINGSDVGKTQTMDWKRLIRPINRSEFNLGTLLELICGELNFDGPIIVQCYNLKAPARTILQETFDRWKTLSKHCRKACVSGGKQP
jgi:sugar phosphate isomerase/epimerase